MQNRSAAIHKLFGAFFAAVLILTLAAATHANNDSPPLRARQLNGMKVEDSDGHKAGTIRNLVLDMNTGNLRYVVIGSGGYLGLRATSRLAPVQVMSAATAKSETLAIHATTPQWRQAPVFKYSNLAAIANQESAGEIARYFQISKTNHMGKEIAVSLSKTGRDSTPEPLLKFASDVMGMLVVNQKREKMGEVVDFLVSFGEPRPAFAVICSGRLFHPYHQYAVPLNTLALSDNKLLWNVDAAALPNAPEFNLEAWESRGGNIHQIYRYSTPAD